LLDSLLQESQAWCKICDNSELKSKIIKLKDAEARK